MEHNTDRILWTVLVLAIGVALFVIFKPAANGLLSQGVEKIQDVVTNVNGDKSDSGTVDASSKSDFIYSEPNKADNTISIIGYSGHAEDLTTPQYHKIGSVSYKVTVIGDKAFYENTSIKQVTIPDGVTSIGNNAFYSTKLTRVNLPASLTSIGKLAFANAPLTSVDLPAGLTSIGVAAFDNTALTSVDIPDSVTLIEKDAFASTKLTSIDIPDSVTSIGDYAFYGTKLTSVDFPASVTSVGQLAFYNTPISAISFKKRVDLGDYAFANTKLTNVTLPTGSTYRIDSATSNSTFDSGVTVTFK